ncbi:MAG: hypothetical protein J5507_02150 [Clostridia bacterium]|nr:hypothetical protein [Clostridia bacterium]
MKKEVTLVPKDKCPLDMLASLGTRTGSAWIFLHQNAVEKLTSIADDSIIRPVSGFRSCHWNPTKDFPETYIQIEENSDKIWLEVYRIDADNISFQFPSDDPCNIFFLKMAE